MPRRAAGLTAARVRTAAPGRYGDGNGLYLLVRSPEARFWLFRYTRAGRMREMGLGRAGSDPGAVTLAEARSRAGELHKRVRAGVDPLDAKHAETAASRARAQQEAVRAITFRSVAEQFIASHEAGWRNPKHRAQWGATLAAYAYPHMGDLPVAEVTTAHVMAALDTIWRTKAETASRVRGRVEAVLDYARARGWRDGANPATWRGHLSELLPSRAKIAPVEHHAALPWPDTAAFMATLRGQSGVGARALEFAILTAARTGEVLGARWTEIDMQAAVWTVPAARMKAGREHRVPLAPAALSVLREVAVLRTTDKPDAFVFPGGMAARPLSNMAMAMTLRRMGRGDLTAHGFRSTFRDWTAERTDYQREVAEAALAHTLDDKVEAAYRRGDLFEKRRRLMADWAAFCGRPAGK